MPVPPKDKDLLEEIRAMQPDDTLPWRITLLTEQERHRFKQMCKRYGRATGHEVIIAISPRCDKAYIIAADEPDEITYGREKGRRKLRT